jgi:hypothetical protein
MIMATGEECPLDVGVYGGNPIIVRWWLLLPEHLYANGLSEARRLPSFNGPPSVDGWAAEQPDDDSPPWECWVSPG